MLSGQPLLAPQTGGLVNNVEIRLTSTRDCQGPGIWMLHPRGTPFRGMHYNSALEKSGARDNKVYFHNTVGVLVATLFLNASAITREINGFWPV